MNYTTNYQLPQWVEEDRIMMEDFNDMAARVDEALGEQGETLAEQGVVLKSKGNCSMMQMTYKGNGGYGETQPNQLTFEVAPQLFFVFSSSSIGVFFGGCSNFLTVRDNFLASGNVSWSSDGKIATWYANHPENQVNGNDVTYTVAAFSRQ